MKFRSVWNYNPNLTDSLRVDTRFSIIFAEWCPVVDLLKDPNHNPTIVTFFISLVTKHNFAEYCIVLLLTRRVANGNLPLGVRNLS